MQPIHPDPLIPIYAAILPGYHPAVIDSRYYFVDRIDGFEKGRHYNAVTGETSKDAFEYGYRRFFRVDYYPNGTHTTTETTGYPFYRRYNPERRYPPYMRSRDI
jgi:hypothetical protein